jgi:hypothetical protein
MHEHQGFVGQAIERLYSSSVAERVGMLMLPLARLLEGLSGEIADVGIRAAQARFALDRRDDLEPTERELIEEALRDTANAGAQAWSRTSQVRDLLATIDRGGEKGALLSHEHRWTSSTTQRSTGWPSCSHVAGRKPGFKVPVLLPIRPPNGPLSASQYPSRSPQAPISWLGGFRVFVLGSSSRFVSACR